MSDDAKFRQKAQDGKAAMMDAIVEFLQWHANYRFTRSEIEDALGLESVYAVAEGGQSYKGALASMLLSKLVDDGRVTREGAKGQKKIYWCPRSF